jgi:starvation-inducible DNA-binding protein
MARPKTLAPRNGRAPAIRKKAIALLNQHLADALDLHALIKRAHRSVKGMQVRRLRTLCDKLAEEFEEYIDLIAERATALGGTGLSTMWMAAEASRLPEYPRDTVDGRQRVAALTARFASFAKTFPAAIEAATGFAHVDTSDLFTEVSRGLDRQLWFLEAHLQS